MQIGKSTNIENLYLIVDANGDNASRYHYIDMTACMLTGIIFELHDANHALIKSVFIVKTVRRGGV